MKSLSDIKGLDKWNVSNCKDLSGMFNRCLSLSDTNFANMFSCCSLTKIILLSEWNVSKNADFIDMFCDCSSFSDITGLDKWKSKKPDINFNEMFSDCFCLFDLNLIDKK